MSQDIMKQIQIFCTQFSEVLFFDLLGLGFVFGFFFLLFCFVFREGLKYFLGRSSVSVLEKWDRSGFLKTLELYEREITSPGYGTEL